MTMGIPIGGGPLPTAEGAPLGRLPAELRGENAPIRDALVAAERAAFEEYERQSEEAAAQSSILRSTGAFLDVDADERGFVRQQGESDADLRARILAGIATVTPVAICAAADRILSAYTAKTSKYAEELDGFFVLPAASAAPWCAFVSSVTGKSRTPTYPDRLYADDAALNGGISIPSRAPGGAVPLPAKGAGRTFTLRIPDLAFVDAIGIYATPATPFNAIESSILYVPDAFPAPSGLTESQIYQAIVNSIEQIKGHGIRWSLVVDPTI